ncbi:PH domain-containing protein [Amycolatopsis sp. A133]|uniref:PH domain-containing protein n=1 Tax=Amycolatopsis sp. A133 TaxID=3064472 RepID=UPI0027EB666C|nr:PH domain-containing protein [Amycolatopsis sp. A133]MDQ7804947.1 PH domain-containing protein [Amycolatopsis sp. A133]
MDVPMKVLLPGEQLLWSGRPQRIAPRGLDWYSLAFGVVWVSVIAASGIGFGREGRTFYIGAAFAVFGLATAWGPVIGRLWALRRAVYAVTDQRVVVADGVSGRTRASAYLRALPPPVTQPREDGVGTVTFGEAGGLLSLFGGAQATAGSKSSQVPIVLVAVPEAERVRDLIARGQAAGA